LAFPRLEPQFLETLAADYDLLHLEMAAGMDSQPPERLHGIRAVLTAGPIGFTQAMFEACPDIEAVVTLGAGFDRVDLRTAKSRGIVLGNASGANAGCVAEHSMALLLALVRRIPQLHARVAAGKWRPRGEHRQVSGRRLGIIGMGAIGREIARMAGAFGMEIAYMGRSRRPELPFQFFAEPAALADFAEVLVLACPGGRETHHLVGKDVLAALGPEGYLVNIARGSVVDTAALVEALRAETIAGAALDVFDNEPKVPAELRALENVILTPHVAGNSIESRAAMFAQARANLAAFFAGEPLPGAVAIP
jgi:lactate dehydrogenase-like 2-hydroxyacid dehydrogenase